MRAPWTSYLHPMAFGRGLSRRLSKVLPLRPRRLRLDAPLVSFSFDDFPASAASVGAPILEAAGYRATFYLSTGLLGRMLDGREVADAAMVRALSARGHEIGAHTHAHLDVQATPTPTLLADIAANRAAIAHLTGRSDAGHGAAPYSFAYPYGIASPRATWVLRHRFRALRGIQPGLNVGTIDLAHLRTQELYDATSTPASVAALLDETVRRKAWLILYTHDVAPAPSEIGCSTALFETTVAAVEARGLRVETVTGALDAMGVR